MKLLILATEATFYSLQRLFRFQPKEVVLAHTKNVSSAEEILTKWKADAILLEEAALGSQENFPKVRQFGKPLLVLQTPDCLRDELGGDTLESRFFGSDRLYFLTLPDSQRQFQLPEFQRKLISRLDEIEIVAA